MKNIVLATSLVTFPVVALSVVFVGIGQMLWYSLLGTEDIMLVDILSILSVSIPLGIYYIAFTTKIIGAILYNCDLKTKGTRCMIGFVTMALIAIAIDIYIMKLIFSNEISNYYNIVFFAKINIDAIYGICIFTTTVLLFKYFKRCLKYGAQNA